MWILFSVELSCVSLSFMFFFFALRGFILFDFSSYTYWEMCVRFGIKYVCIFGVSCLYVFMRACTVCRCWVGRWCGSGSSKCAWHHLALCPLPTSCLAHTTRGPPSLPCPGGGCLCHLIVCLTALSVSAGRAVSPPLTMGASNRRFCWASGSLGWHSIDS